MARLNKEEILIHTSLSYPLNKNFILRKKKSIKKILLNNKYLEERKIAILGGSTTSEIKNILKDENYKKYFGGKFESLSELKTAPRGFDKEHPDVNLLRKKGFIASRKFTDAEVLSPDFVNNVDESFKALRPFFNLFSDILTTNLNGEQLI